MSLSEIFDNGANHPWANFRINNLAVNNNLTVGNTITTDIINYTGRLNGGKGAVTQIGGPTSSVSLDSPTGQITGNNAYPFGVSSFTVNNPLVASSNLCMTSFQFSGTIGATIYVWADNFVAGSGFRMNVRNDTTGSITITGILQITYMLI